MGNRSQNARAFASALDSTTLNAVARAIAVAITTLQNTHRFVRIAPSYLCRLTSRMSGWRQGRAATLATVRLDAVVGRLSQEVLTLAQQVHELRFYR